MTLEELKAKELQLFKKRESLINVREKAELPAKQVFGEKLRNEFVEYFMNREFTIEESQNNIVLFVGNHYSVELKDIGEHENVEFVIYFSKNNSDFIPAMLAQYIIVEPTEETLINLTYRGYSYGDEISYLGKEKGDTEESLLTLIKELEYDISLLNNKTQKEKELNYAISDKPGFSTNTKYINAKDVISSLNNIYTAQINI